jgi:hypothetical protein
MSVHRLLVTSDADRRMDVWAATGTYANWIEGRENGDRETWLVTCFDDHREAFLAAACAAGVTVERIDGAGEDESYELLAGEPGTGWARTVT